MSDQRTWSYIFEKTDRFFHRNPIAMRIGAAGLVVFVLIWMFVGFWMPFVFTTGLDWPEKAGQFGDMFGAANSLFSGVALIGVAYALILQQREAQSNEEAHRRQQHIAEASARIDTYLAFADFQYQLMKEAPAQYQEPYQWKARHAMKQVIKLMELIGEKLEQDEAIACDFYSSADHAIATLEEITSVFVGTLERFEADDDNYMALYALKSAHDSLSVWHRQYSDLMADRVSQLMELITSSFDLDSEPLPNPDIVEVPSSDCRRNWSIFWSRVQIVRAQLVQAANDIKEHYRGGVYPQT